MHSRIAGKFRIFSNGADLITALASMFGQAEGNSRDHAIISAMADCKKEGILEDFLREHGTEAVNMLFTEFNMEDALEVRAKDITDFESQLH